MARKQEKGLFWGAVNQEKSLLIRDLSVVESSFGKAGGKWSFGALLKSIAPPEADPSLLAEQWVESLGTGAAVGEFAFAAFPELKKKFLAKWPRTAAGSLDLNRAPFRLYAITIRTDLQGSLGNVDTMGETRLLFADTLGSIPSFMAIFEYGNPKNYPFKNAFVHLSNISFGDEFNLALDHILSKIIPFGSNPTRSQRTSLNQMRINWKDSNSLEGWKQAEYQVDLVLILNSRL